MGTSKRLDRAIKKLYIAFYNGTLHPECSKSCAVGNILDNKDSWKHLSDSHGSLQLNYVGLVNQNLGRKFNGYSPVELLQIESEFLEGCGYVLPLNASNRKPKNPTDKEVLFQGLSKAIALLCALDGVENVMDYSRLFQSQNKTQPYAIAEVMEV
ncbi:Na(+)-translocating NADH-quinone reductase subunit F [Flavobacteriaceae bacterium F89]|uniref:Na(+)-translocating NADH-quinone reductase subunit F n=1 Tax=Cerina litoralis TaxID=2874477 RepID=A0AAE3JNK2_9FLAO|nr:Na(+)-translocating NADH-quinone reductase subunit F [Cerina litoralis]MCG2459961.1 Na(+)-translocating NADH-quinone reductase subunit F [Cerina litoralis]